jgi:hypothetical protein
MAEKFLPFPRMPLQADFSLPLDNRVEVMGRSRHHVAPWPERPN